MQLMKTRRGLREDKIENTLFHIFNTDWEIMTFRPLIGKL